MEIRGLEFQEPYRGGLENTGLMIENLRVFGVREELNVGRDCKKDQGNAIPNGREGYILIILKVFGDTPWILGTLEGFRRGFGDREKHMGHWTWVSGTSGRVLGVRQGLESQ